MATSEHMCELHLRMVGEPRNLMLRLHGNMPTEDDVAAWMKEGSVIQLQVSEAGVQAPHTMLVNFGSVVFAWLMSDKPGRGVDL
ncbi:hypothetical protein [Streptosporangium subroseum]|uniref:hypothetical protein n=1 Tax=Streptosporangium subroseum TaxID=106412 RepID=UPI0030889676|nr:hypothetical protein OHB15_11355 [Streptosporangium subroseum]